MAVYTVLDRPEIERFVRAFGLGPLRSARGVAGGTINTIYELRTGRGRFILRVLEDRPLRDADFEAAVLARLAARGLPVPRPCRAAGGALVISRGPRQHVSVFDFLPGGEIDPRRIGAVHTEQVGELLARMHVALRGLRRTRRNAFDAPAMQRLGRVCRRAFAADPSRFTAEHRRTLDRIEPVIRAQARRRRTELPTGIVHGDLFTDNVRFARDRLVGVLDFEMASTEELAYDVAVALCDWCFSRGRLRPQPARALIRGYERVRPLEPSERAALWDLAAFVTARYTMTRLHDFEVQAHAGVHRVVKDYRDFLARFDAVQALGPTGFARTVLAPTARR